MLYQQSSLQALPALTRVKLDGEFDPQALYILLGVFGLILLYYFLKKFFAAGIIQDGYLLEQDGSVYLLLLLDYEISITSRSGISLHHSYKLKKINLDALTVDYEVELASFGSDMLGGWLPVLGANADFWFFVEPGHSLIVVNNRTGQRQGDHRDIIRRNPHLIGFDVDLCEYSRSLQTVVIFDNHGQGHRLDPETLRTEPVDSGSVAAGDPVNMLRLSDLPTAAIKPAYVTREEPHPCYGPAHGKELALIQEPGSKRYAVQIKGYCSDAEPEGLAQSFLNPKVIGRQFSEALLSRRPPSVAIVYGDSFDATAEQLMVARVNDRSRVMWQHALADIVVKPGRSDAETLCYMQSGKKLYFICTAGGSHRLSLAVVDKSRGVIERGPVLVANRNHCGGIRRASGGRH